MTGLLFYSLVAALDAQEEHERFDAVYNLGWGRDKRAIPYLIRVLRNRQETSSIRGQAAEGLSLLGKRKAIRPLVECSADDSAEVRFWCVFALGNFVRRRKTPAIVVRALEERLQDNECPDDRGNWWPVRLEALAMLGGNRGWWSRSKYYYLIPYRSCMLRWGVRNGRNPKGTASLPNLRIPSAGAPGETFCDVNLLHG